MSSENHSNLDNEVAKVDQGKDLDSVSNNEESLEAHGDDSDRDNPDINSDNSPEATQSAIESFHSDDDSVVEGLVYNPLPSYAPIRPGVEWIYLDPDISTNNDTNQNSEANTIGDQIPYRDVDYIVDPMHTSIIPVIDGEIVSAKRCFLKLFGFTICDDAFPCSLNPKAYPLLIVLLIIVGATTGAVLNMSDNAASAISLTNDFDTSTLPSIQAMPSSLPSIQNFPSIIPSYMPSHVPIDMRVVNITQALLEISGDVVLEHNSSQNKALRWILEEDGMNLTSSSSNLVQRYVMMVMYYSLSGDAWTTNAGYESDEHECTWHGIECRFGSVELIDLGRLNLRGSIPREIGHLSRLTTLRLGSNGVTGTIPDEIGNCSQLRRLRVVGNRLTGTIPSSIGNLRFLTHLYIDRNELSGTIPSELSGSFMIQEFFAYRNRLTGSIPSELGNLQLMSALRLDMNNLNGTIPSEVGNLVNLQRLWLHGNALSGVIPSSFDQLTFLGELYLGRNVVTGTIPDFFGTFSNNEKLDLAANAINGTIPSSLGQLTRMNELRLDNNILTGTMPEEICSLSLEVLTADCGGDEPEIDCECCTQCLIER